MSNVRVFFMNEHTGKKYEVIGRDTAAGTVTLRGENATFEEPYDKQRFAEMGYRLVKEPQDAVE